ncbi:TadE/TadG family type IV pilus assembly protein [Bradyrhizobium sp. USDA 4454]
MLGPAIFDRVCAAARRFARAKDGNVAVIFTLAILPIFAFIGAAIDYTRANNARTAMQSALDSAALMLSKDLTMGNITAAQIPSKAQSYFDGLYTNKDGQGISISATYTTPTSSTAATILLGGTGFIKSDFMQLAGFPTLNFSSSSTTTWGNVKMRVALALDNTGSMSQNGKITALRNAVAGSGGLIDQLSALSKNNGDVYISVIPFAKVVNLSASNYGQSYIDWTDWLNPPTAQPAIPSSMAASLPMNWHAVGPGAQCPWSNSNGGFYCTTGPTNGSGRSPNNYSTNTIPSSGTYKGYICPSVDYNTHTMYNGCWESKQVGTTAQTFCSGSSNCACPLDANNNNVAGCSCSGSGTSRTCSGYIYTHDWTQPGPNDTADNPGQPRVSAVVGWTNNKWTATNQTPTVQNDWRQASTNPITTWTGCITDRTQPNDATGVLPTSSDVTTLFPANQYYENNSAYCADNASPQLEPIIPLTYNWSALKTAVNAMQPTGGTDQSVGLAWAWQSLLVGGPLNTPAEDSNTTYNRVIILLSDGLNTEDRWPNYGDGSSQASGNPIDARQALQCQNLQNAKDSNGAPMFTIYTIQVNTSTPADPTSTVLKNCASTPDKFFMLTSSSQIVTTFNTIGTALSKLRLAK